MSLFRRHKQPEEVRPRVGTLTRASGVQEPLRFVSTEDPTTFLAVTPDGERVSVEPGDQVQVDVIGPGQAVRFGDGGL